MSIEQSILVALAVMLGMFVAMEASYRYAKHRRMPEAIKGQVGMILGSMLGFLALLLGFTFSLALQRYEDRSQAIVSEANAIGTTYLRVKLLPSPMQAEVEDLLKNYLETRVQEAHLPLSDHQRRQDLLAEGEMLANRLWMQVQRVVESSQQPVLSALFITSLNEMIDAYGVRNAALERHVPNIVLSLLFSTSIMTSATLGYASGSYGHRVSAPGLALVVLIGFANFLIIDLDMPRQGLIQVSQESMLNLQETLVTQSQPAKLINGQ